MSKTDIVPGHATVDDFAYWINARHLIYKKRLKNRPKPWTVDPILRDYKFTNVFRELDKGTVVLRGEINRAIKEEAPLEDILFNTIWYRYFNWYENLNDVGFCMEYEQLYDGLYARYNSGAKIFTACHMTTGRPGEDKIDTYMGACKEAYDKRKDLLKEIQDGPLTLEHGFNVLQQLDLVGPFVAYEMVSDLRWTPILELAEDRITWANLGPGCKRGLRRLGMPEELASIRDLWKCAPQYLEDHVMGHLNEALKGMGQFVRGDKLKKYPRQWPPFEMREIEHSLCEFDKYQRVKTGVGRPREKYNGRD